MAGTLESDVFAQLHTPNIYGINQELAKAEHITCAYFLHHVIPLLLRALINVRAPQLRIMIRLNS